MEEARASQEIMRKHAASKIQVRCILPPLAPNWWECCRSSRCLCLWLRPFYPASCLQAVWRGYKVRNAGKGGGKKGKGKGKKGKKK